MQYELNLEKKCDEKIVRRLRDLKDSFSDFKGVKKILEKHNPVIYEVFIKKMPGFNVGLTIINPGTIGIRKEFYMTKGHRHKKPSLELYFLIEGKGKLIIQNTSSETIELKKNKVHIVPKNYAHRLVNAGNKKLEVLTIYSAIAGHDYNIQFKKRLFKNESI